MSTTARVVAALMVIGWAPPTGRRFVPGAVVLLWSLPLAVAVGGWTWVRHRRRSSERAVVASGAVDDQIDLLVDLVALGLSAGWGFVQTLDWARSRLEPPLRVEVAALVRRLRHQGPGALDGAQGHAAGLYRLVGRALDTGAPLLGAVETYARDRMSERKQRALTAARRLPVVLVFPLTLLILPGFVLVTVAPALTTALERIGS